MKNFAGLDLSQLNLNILSTDELRTIERAFLENYKKVAGDIDLSQAETVLDAIMRFVKISMVTPNAIDGALNATDSLTAMAIYYLPLTSKQIVIQNAIFQLQQLPNYAHVQKIQKEKFSLSNIALLWDLIKDYKDKFNFTGFPDRSAEQLYNAVGFELYTEAHAKLKKLGEVQIYNAQDYAWKYLSLQYILHRIHERLQRRDFRFGLDVSDTKKEVNKLSRTTYKYMLHTLSDIIDLPQFPQESLARPLLHRFNAATPQSSTVPDVAEIIAKRSAKVAPM